MEINEIIGKNLADLRKSQGLTQREVAVKLDFSDKSVSKWESGESVPSVDVLYKLANLYSVKLDYFVTEEHNVEQVVTEPVVEPKHTASRYRYSRVAISLLCILVVWTTAVCLFAFLQNTTPTIWIGFVWSVPISFALAIIFNSIWGKPRDTFIYISLLIWTLIAALFIQVLLSGAVFWQIFLIGIPMQLGVILWANLVLKNRSHDPATIRARREYQKELALKKREKREKKAQLRQEQKAQEKLEKQNIKAAKKQDKQEEKTQDHLALKPAKEETKQEDIITKDEPTKPAKQDNIIQDLI